MTRGNAIGLRDSEGTIVTSAASLPYDGPFGFIGIVLVKESWRRRGLATSLLNRCVVTLRETGHTPVLDATSAGETVYRKQGFDVHFRYDRWRGLGTGRTESSSRATDDDTAIALDAEAFGAARSLLIQDFLGREGTSFIVDGDDGFAVMRRGRRAYQLGPVVASSDRQASALMFALLARVSGPVIIDIPSSWKNVGLSLADRNFVIERSFARMALDRTETFGNPRRLFAVSGPEFG